MKITARQVLRDMKGADREKVLDYLKQNQTSRRIFKHDFTAEFFEDLTDRRDNKIKQHCVMFIFGFTGCLSGDTILKGHNKPLKHQICDGVVQTTSIDTSNGKIVPSSSMITFSGKKQVYRIVLEDGRYVDATADHTFFLKYKGKIVERKVSELEVGRQLVVNDGN